MCKVTFEISLENINLILSHSAIIQNSMQNFEKKMPFLNEL